ncbi:MAG: histidine kinase [Pedobacter agri]
MKIKTQQLGAKTIILFFIVLMISKNVAAQKQGIAAIDSMITLLKPSQKLDTAQIKIIYRIAAAYRNIDTDSCLRYTKAGLERAQKVGWKKGTSAFYDMLGSIYSAQSEYNKALVYFNKSLKIIYEINYPRGEASCLINIAVVYESIGKRTEALDNYFKALKITQKIKYDPYTALIYGNISNVYITQKNHKLALNYAFKSYEAYKKIEDGHGIAQSGYVIATAYFNNNELQKANSFALKSLTKFKEIDEKVGQANVLGLLALINDDDKIKKLTYLFQSQKLHNETNPNSSSSITDLGNIGGTYADIYINKTKDKFEKNTVIPNDYVSIYNNAILYLSKALDISKKANEKDNISYFSDNLAKLQEHKGDYKNALTNFKISKQIQDSLYSQESKNKIATLEAQFAFQKKEDHYKQQQELAKIKTQQIYLYSGLVLLLVSSVLIYFLNRSNINQLRLKNTLQMKESEEQAKELLHQSKLLESELKAIRSQMNPHFIFNVLNSIEAYIIDNDKYTASRLIQKFAALSRLILENSTRSLVTADREWKALKLYTELEAMRYNNAFSFNFEADESLHLTTLLLPPMLIQPLIENAILHGLIVNPKPGAHLEVQLKKHEQGICITVEDNGNGLEHQPVTRPKTGVKEKSMGLASIKERIAMINAQTNNYLASFKIMPRAEGDGTFATIHLPNFDGAVV